MEPEHLGVEFGLTAADAARFKSKASAWKGLVSALEQKGLHDQVLAKVPEAVAKLMQHPPTGGAWMPAVAFSYVFVALHGTLDDEQMRAVASSSILRGPMKTMKPMVEGMLRLFGTSPLAFFRRLPKIMAQQLQGVTFDLVEAQDTEVLVQVRYHYVRGLPREAFVYWDGVQRSTFDICGVGPTHCSMKIESEDSSARYHYRW
ncbi:MAG: hypothetical protein AAF799_03335 [Myxococcota bacterium]